MSHGILLQPHHMYLRSSTIMDELLSPLKRFGITMLSFSRLYGDRTQIYLSNCAGWVEDYYKEALFCSFIPNTPHKYQSRILAWPNDSPHPVFQLARQRYNSDNGVTLVRVGRGYCDYYFFSGEVSNKSLINFYFNFTDILNNFVLYFEDKAAKLISDATKCKISLPLKSGSGVIAVPDSIYPVQDHITDAFKEMRLNKYQFKQKGYENVKLSAREIECIYLLDRGDSAKETARTLGLSFRTVERYFESIKLKLSCNTRREILDLVSKEGLIRSFHSHIGEKD